MLIGIVQTLKQKLRKHENKMLGAFSLYEVHAI